MWVGTSNAKICAGIFPYFISTNPPKSSGQWAYLFLFSDPNIWNDSFKTQVKDIDKSKHRKS